VFSALNSVLAAYRRACANRIFSQNILMATSCLFRLYLLTNCQSLHDYPYLALCDESDRSISICNEHICIENRADVESFATADYLATSRFISVDIGLVIRLVELYMGTDDCTVTARFTEDKHVTLTYRLAPVNKQRTHDLYDDGSNMTAEIVVTKLMPIMEAIRQAVETIDE
jgi:hypothetical protein